MLEKSVAQANAYFMDHHLMMGVINEGGILSTGKLMIPMLYFDTSQCRVSPLYLFILRYLQLN